MLEITKKVLHLKINRKFTPYEQIKSTYNFYLTDKQTSDFSRSTDTIITVSKKCVFLFLFIFTFIILKLLQLSFGLFHLKKNNVFSLLNRAFINFIVNNCIYNVVNLNAKYFLTSIKILFYNIKVNT